MPSFLQLPGELPWWATLALIVPAALYGLLLLAMPFNVFGIKGRMDSIEAQLDEIQQEIRSLSLRLPEPEASDPAGTISMMGTRPPIPPTVVDDGQDLPRFQSAPPDIRRSTARPPRSEPRLDWPR